MRSRNFFIRLEYFSTTCICKKLLKMVQMFFARFVYMHDIIKIFDIPRLAILSSIPFLPVTPCG